MAWMKLLLVAIISIVSCRSEAQKVYSDDFYKTLKEEYPQRPKKKFRFNRKRLARMSGRNRPKSEIDFKALYIIKIYNRQLKDTTYAFYRFFPDGEVYSSEEYISEPTEKEGDDLSYGSWEMYRIKKNGDLVMERPLNHDFVNWDYSHAHPDSKGLTKYREHLGRLITGSSRKVNYYWYKKKVDLNNFNVNWK